MNLSIMPNFVAQTQKCANSKSNNTYKSTSNVSFKSKEDVGLIKCLLDIAASESKNRSLLVDFKSMLSMLKMCGVTVKKAQFKTKPKVIYSYLLQEKSGAKIGNLTYTREPKLSQASVKFESGQSDADTLSLTVVNNKNK